MERGAIGKLIPADGQDGDFEWFTGPSIGNSRGVWGEEGRITQVKYKGAKVAVFWGDDAIRLERVALFLTTEQS